jgi:drug/metabolite transporter (DMT)-like permease
MVDLGSFPCQRPATWKVALAFALLYLSWGTTYFAIRIGVHDYGVPPALFSGVRVALAGWLLLAYLAACGESIRLELGDLLWIWLSGSLLFIAGNGLLTTALRDLPSGITAVLTATTPLWMALLEVVWPRGDRLRPRGWFGLVVGLCGVIVLLAPRLRGVTILRETGPVIALSSNVLWAIGSLLVRHHRQRANHLVTAAYQMILGGTGLALAGAALGEFGALTAQCFAPGALAAFLYLLIVGSLVGFVAFNWLLGHVPAAMVGTYAYVNPLVAILVARFLAKEEITNEIVLGMLIILAGVALVQGTAVKRAAPMHVDANEPLALAQTGKTCAKPELLPCSPRPSD